MPLSFKLFGFEFGKVEQPELEQTAEPINAYGGSQNLPNYRHSFFTGEKFAGGFGYTEVFETDYWTLRQRSSQLFTSNIYASGIIKRLVTNEINTGLTPEVSPFEAILGLSEDQANDWSEITEARWQLWANTPKACDYYERETLGAIQRKSRMESLIEGDVLVVLHQNSATNLPQVQVVRGSCVCSPLTGSAAKTKNRIEHGVEIDNRGRHVAFHVRQPDGTFKRIQAYGQSSGRRLAWMVYGSAKRMHEVRGMPLLSVIMQSLQSIDKYRDSTQLQAEVLANFVAFVESNNDAPSLGAFQGSAVKKSTVQGVTDDEAPINTTLLQHSPGTVHELPAGKTVKMPAGNGTDLNFGSFEDTIIRAIAWSLEVPPEIMQLSFSSNYSASQAAVNEFNMYLHMVRAIFGECLCQPIYEEWLVNEALNRKIKAQGMLDAWRDPMKFDIFAAWVGCGWHGSIKPSIDILKRVKGAELLVMGGFSTRSREARMMTGSSFKDNTTRLRRENEQLVKAAEPLAKFKQEYGENPQDLIAATASATTQDEDDLKATFEEYLADA